jgi:hypothetical protein
MLEHNTRQASFRQGRLLEGYCFSLQRGKAQVRSMIMGDIDSFSDLGADRHAWDLAEVLKRFDLDHPLRPSHAAD